MRELHRDTEFCDTSVTKDGTRFMVYRIKRDDKNYESQFNYYFNVIWGSAAVKHIKPYVREFMVFFTQCRTGMEISFYMHKQHYSVDLERGRYNMARSYLESGGRFLPVHLLLADEYDSNVTEFFKRRDVATLNERGNGTT